MLAEFEFIEYLKQKYAVRSPFVYGIGDDCAVIPLSEEYSYLVSSDVLVEGVHFDLALSSFEDVGYKAVAVNISDVVAMGGVPRYLFVSLCVPKRIAMSSIEELYRGVQSCLKKYHVFMLGGDSSASGELMVSITVIGIQRTKRILYRHSAQCRDRVYVTGYLGDSAAGLFLLRNPSCATLSRTHRHYLIRRHKRPDIRFRAIQYLQRRYDIHAAIDVSDGLLGDLRHILTASKLGAVLVWGALKCSPAFHELTYAEKYNEFFFNGGEDYEVLFTSPQEIDCAAFEAIFQVPLSCIGFLQPEGFFLQKDGQVYELQPKSFEHYTS